MSTERERAAALRDAICQIWSATGAYSHDIPRLAKAAIERDNAYLDALRASSASEGAPDELREALQAIVDDAVGERRDPLWIVKAELIRRGFEALRHASPAVSPAPPEKESR